MVFFLTAALYAFARLIVEDDVVTQRSLARARALLAIAYLAKPVALVALVPVVGMLSGAHAQCAGRAPDRRSWYFRSCR